MPSPRPANAADSFAGVPSSRQPGLREQFAAEELAVVLSHFDLGLLDSVQEFPRGSRRAPKLLIQAASGKYLLKRRARGRDDPAKVAFSHALQQELARQHFPLPRLIDTRDDHQTLLQWRGAVYEVFEYIAGQSYPQTLEATYDAGRVLGRFHQLLETFQGQWPSGAAGSYHNAASIETGLSEIAQVLPVPSAAQAEAQALLRALLDQYRHAVQVVQSLGYDAWARQAVHADWHPGNLLYRENRVAAVIDFDSARRLPRIIDLANGALQFSMVSGDLDVSQWPDYLDETRFKRFLRGYETVLIPRPAEARAVPWLMIEALIAQAVFPIAATGYFGQIAGWPFLQMVQRKTRWIDRHARDLDELVRG